MPPGAVAGMGGCFVAVESGGHFLLHLRLFPVLAKEAALEGQYLGLERCHRFLKSPIAIDLSVL